MRTMINKEKTIHIALVEGNLLFREGMKRIIETDADLEVIAEGEKKEDAFSLIDQYHPDILLLNVSMLEGECLQEIERIATYSPKTSVIVLSDQYEHSNHVLKVLKQGAHGVLLKEMNEELFIEAIKSVYNGKFWLHPDISHDLVEEYYKLKSFIQEETERREKVFQKPLHIFTSRECEVLDLLVKGKTNIEIANCLGITSSTVKNHVRNILGKMNVNDRTNAVVLAIQNGWVELKGGRWNEIRKTI